MIEFLRKDLRRGRHRLEEIELEAAIASNWIDWFVLVAEWILINSRYSIPYAILSSLQWFARKG